MRRVMEELNAPDMRAPDEIVRVVGRKGASRRQVPDVKGTINRVLKDPNIPPEMAMGIIARAKAAHEQSRVRSDRARVAWAARKARAEAEASSQPPQASAP